MKSAGFPPSGQVGAPSWSVRWTGDVISWRLRSDHHLHPPPSMSSAPTRRGMMSCDNKKKSESIESRIQHHRLTRDLVSSKPPSRFEQEAVSRPLLVVSTLQTFGSHVSVTPPVGSIRSHYAPPDSSRGKKASPPRGVPGPESPCHPVINSSRTCHAPFVIASNQTS
jgi:hypothetical protein